MRTAAIGVLALFALSSGGMASTARHPSTQQYPGGVLLIKHDKEKHGFKSGHGEDEDEDRDEDESRGQRPFNGSSRGYYPPGYYPAPPSYYAPYSPYNYRPLPSP